MEDISKIIVDALRNDEQARYVYIEEPVSRADAQRARLDSINYAYARVQEAERELMEAKAAPLQTTRSKQIRLLPGNPGYDEAPVAFDPMRYQGDSPWMQIVEPKI